MIFMNMFKPTWMVESIFNITSGELKKYGFKGVMADLDNTLVAWNHWGYEDQTLQWMDMITANHIPVVIVSNNNADRIQPLADAFDLPFVSSALKPLSRGFKRGQEKLGLKKSEILMVGDQLLTDIYGGNRFGLHTALVKPIVPTDAGTTKINRRIERFIMQNLMKHDPDMKWRHSLDEPLRPAHD